MSDKPVTPCVNHRDRHASRFLYDPLGQTRAGHVCHDCWNAAHGYILPFDELVRLSDLRPVDTGDTPRR